MMQRLGERIDEEESHAVKQMNTDKVEGKKIIPVLLEEMDGELEKQKRSTLVGRTMLAGMENSTDFHAKREASIRKNIKRMK